jgi:hypothetical protein
MRSEKKKRKMTNIISRCIICGQFFQSKKGLKDHKDRNHRITNSKIVPQGPTASDNNNYYY